MREWLSGGAPPCQGGGRGFDPRLALLKTLDFSRVFLFHVAFHVASDEFLLFISFLNSKLVDSKSIPISDAFETASGVSLSGNSHIIIKRGNAMYVELYFSGSIATGSNGQVKIGNIKSPYRPSVFQCCATRINRAVSGQIYAATLITVSTNGDVNLVTGDNDKSYGSTSYPWSTNGGIDFTYFL